MMKTRKLVYISLLVAQAIILNYIERAFIPLNTGIPGAKLGLANIITLISLNTLSLKSTFLVILARTALSASMFGNVSGFIYALSGAVLSFLVMTLLLKSKRVSLLTISIIGAISHNIGQLISAAIFIENSKIFIYLPFLVLIAIPTGLFIGVVSKGLLKYLYKTDLYFKEK